MILLFRPGRVCRAHRQPTKRIGDPLRSARQHIETVSAYQFGGPECCDRTRDIIALMVSAANMRKVRRFLENLKTGKTTPENVPPAKRARRLSSSLRDHLPDVDNPAWTPGRTKPS